MGKFGLISPGILASSPSSVIGSGSAPPASLAVENLLTPHLWQKWRSNSYARLQCMILAGVSGETGSTTLYADAFALLGANLFPGNAEFCFILAEDSNMGSAVASIESLAPTSTESLTVDVTGTSEAVNLHLNVDELIIVAPDANTVSQNAATATAHFGFNTPSASPRTGSRRQCFRVVAHATADTTGANIHKRPEMQIFVYESGTPLELNGQVQATTKYISGTDEHIVFFSWDAAELADPTGADVEIVIQMTEGNTGIRIVLDAISWECESDQITGEATYVNDSGWQLVPTGPNSGIDLGFGQTLNYAFGPRYKRDAFYRFDEIQEFGIVYMLIREDHTPSPVLSGITGTLISVGEPPGYIEAGVFDFGPWWTPAIEQAHGEYLRLDPLDDIVTTDGGGRAGVKRRPLRGLKVSLPFLTINEMAYLQQIYDQYGTITPFYASLSPSEETDVFASGWFCFEGPITFGRQAHTYQGSADFVLREVR